MPKKRSYTALRRKYYKTTDIETCVIKDKYENQTITKDPRYHGKERLGNMQSITDFRVVNEVKPYEQEEFPPVPQDIYSSAQIMRAFPLPIQTQNGKKKSKKASKAKDIPDSNQVSPDKRETAFKELLIEDMDKDVDGLREESEELSVADSSRREGDISQRRSV